MSKRQQPSSVLIGDVAGSVLRRARLAAEVREVAERLWGVEDTVDLSPAQLAQLILKTLALSAWRERVQSAASRTLDLFDRSNDGRPYTFPIRNEKSIILTSDVVLICPQCFQLGAPQLRHMGDRPEIRNQPLCSTCRSKKH